MESSKIKAWKQNLYRKSLISEKGEVSLLGKELLENILQAKCPRGVIKKIRKQTDEDFEAWWKEYPSTDIFEYRGRKFTGSRGFKVKKEDCKKKFNEIILEGEYNAEQLIEALKCEVHLKKEQSLKDNENKMKYMQNSLTYLNQRTFENFIHNAKELLAKKPSLDSSSNTVDI